MGKRTTTRHKEDNTFRFQTFEEKLRQISVNVNLEIRDGRADKSALSGTYFCQEIEKWVDLNRTESFANLLCEIGTDSRTLAQLLLQKERLVRILDAHLRNADNLASFEPGFGLVIALSRDLEEEFYPYFSTFFETIIKIVMESKKTNIIESGFKCYAYLSKYLRRQIIKDLQQHMKMFSCFLDPKLKTYVMIFACEAFSIVAGKYARDHPEKFMKLVFGVFLKRHPEHAVGVATLLFSIFKGVGGTLKLEGGGMHFKKCVLFLSQLENADEVKIWSDVLCQLSLRLLNHANASNSLHLFHLMEGLLMENLEKNQSVEDILNVYVKMIDFGQAGKLTDVASCTKVLQAISTQPEICKANCSFLSCAVTTIIESKCSSFDTETINLLQPIIQNLLGVVPFDLLETLDRCLRRFRGYFRIFLEPVINAYVRTKPEHPEYLSKCEDITVYCLSEAVLEQGGSFELSEEDSHYFSADTAPMSFFQDQKRIITVWNASSLKGTAWDCCSRLKEAENAILQGIPDTKISYYIRLLMVFSRLNSKSCETCLQTCIRLLRKMLQLENLNSLVPVIFYSLQIFITQCSSKATFYEQLPLKELLNLLRDKISGAATNASFCLWSLKVFDTLVYYIKLSDFKPHLEDLKEFMQDMWCSLTSNLQSGFRMVRALSLSILKSTLGMAGETSEKTSEMINKCLELEDMSLSNSKFSSLAKSILTECKVIVGSETYDINLKLLCLKYTLGLMYTNYNLIWSPCVEVIRHGGKHMEMTEYWKVFGVHFCVNQSYPEEKGPDVIRTKVLPQIDESATPDFMDVITIQSLGLPKIEGGFSEAEEQLDIFQYKINLWLSLKGQPLTKVQYSDIKYYVEKIIGGPTDKDEENISLRRERAKTIIPVLQFLEVCDLVNVNHELWEAALKYLTYSQDVQKAAWKFLFAKRKNKLKNYKEDIDHVINSDSMDTVHKFRVDAIDVSLNKQYENESAERRSILMELLIRILIGKERVMKGEKRTQVLRFLAGCTESDAKKYLSLTVGSSEEVRILPPKIIEVKINKMTSALRTWRYKFPNILDDIVNGVCDLTSAVDSSVKPLARRSFNPDEQIPDDVYEEQKKAAVKAGRICIVAFFSSLPRLDMKQETINRIFDVLIWPSLANITTTSAGSVSWILKLFLVWSTHERYHPLFTKCKDGNVRESPMWRLFDLLDSKSTVFEVKKYILGIIFNLTNPPEIVEDLEDSAEEYLNCTNSPLNISDTYTFESAGESVGINIVLLRKDVVLNLFQDSQTFKKFTTQAGGSNCLSLVSLLAGFATGGELNEPLCSVIIDTFPMSKNNEENLFNSITAVGKLLLRVANPFQLIMKLASSFSWINGRRLRTALFETLKCKQGTALYDIISGINAWADLAVDTPNFSKRQESFDKAEKYIQANGFQLMDHTLLFYNCVYGILKEDDLGMRNAAKNLLLSMALKLPVVAQENEQSKLADVHKFLDTVVLPKLRSGVHEKEDKRYEDVLTVLLSFTNSCRELHGTFKELAKILSADVIEGLCDIQVHLRTRSMNRLCKKLKEVVTDVSPAVIQAYILPLASHSLFNEEKLSKNFNELIDSSIEVLKVVMTATSPDQYFSYLNKLLDDPKKHTRLAKQFERVLIAIMDAFHFDLRLSCGKEESKKADNVPLTKSKEDTDSTSNKNGNAEDGEVDDDDFDQEEFNIPRDEEKQLVTLTLIPQPAAVRCLGILKNSIIPKLRKFLHFEQTATHKLSKGKKKVNDDVILKIPCTIALVKLLKKIPKTEGQDGIRSIIPSITAGLRNELVSIRNTLRKTLLNVIKELGTDHLKVVVGYLKSSLKRGYQKHVLNYTVAYLLRCLEHDLKVHPHHVPVKEVLSLCEEELYGYMHEEKEVAAIKQKTREASKSNACPILKVCAKCVSTTDQLNSLIDPAIKHIREKKSPKVAKASRQWLLSVSEGLADNNAVNHEELLAWLLDVTARDCIQVSDADGTEGDQPPSKKRKLLETPKDSKLIPTLKKKSVTEGKANGLSLMTEFSFVSLYNGLNRNGRLREKLINNGSQSMLDNFVPLLADGIQSSSKQVNVVSLRCTTFLFEYDLANFKKPEVIGKLQRHGFIAMNNHCYRNTTDSETTNATFKFLSAFFFRFPDFKIVLQDFELMLKCIQGYLTDGNCSSSALTLLKGVLQNKYRCSVLPDLMQEVFHQCITSYYQHVNEGCRQAYLTYLNNYLTNPKDLYTEVQLILKQLDYKLENGRTTAAEILNSLLQNIPEDCFEEVKELIFLKLLATLDKEKLPKVRERLGDCFKSLFKLEKRKSLAGLLLKLLVHEKHIPELDTFFLIIGLVIDNPKAFTNDEMTTIFERIKDVLDPSSLARMCTNDLRITQQIKDYIIFQALVAFKKALGRNVFDVSLWSPNSPLAETMQQLFGFLKEVYLCYEHEWVPLITIDIFSIVLNNLELIDDNGKAEIAKSLASEKPVCAFLENATDLKELISKLWTAMRKSDREDVLAKGAFALVLLLSVAGRLEDKKIFKTIIVSMKKSVNGEVVNNPRVTTVRSVALGCFRGIAKTSPADAIEEVVESMTRVAVRELTDDNVPQDIRDEAEKLITVLRDVIGKSTFNIIHAKVNDFYHKKRNLNRAKKKETAMLHPGLVRKRPQKTKSSFQSKKKKRK